MTLDKDGKLVPLMLSNLIKSAQEALEKHGDMPCEIDIDITSGSEFTTTYTAPVVYKPNVNPPSFWIDYKLVFTIWY